MADATLTSEMDDFLTTGDLGAAIKTAYEAEADTNAFTDAEKAKVAATSGTNTGDQDLSGLVVKANNLSDLASAATAFANIKQAATTSATGVVELATDGETSAGVVVQGNDSRLSNARTPATHAHGNIANGGTVGTTSGLPLKTGTGGIVEAGAFGSSSGEFCQGNDSRLSDARTPTTHTHGNITNAGAIGSTSGLPVKTGTSGVLEAGAFGTSAGQFAEGNHNHSGVYQPADAQLTDLAGLSYAGNTLKVVRVNAGETSFELAAVSVGGGDMLASNNLSDLASAATAFANIKQAATTSATGVVELATDGETSAGVVVQGNDSRLSDSRTPTTHTHGNIANGGTVGTTSGLPLKTGTGGIVEAGAFGSSAGEFCQGNDSRLSDARTPTSHAHEGTAIASTGETAGTKVLREDGDGTSSWQAITAAMLDGSTASGGDVHVADGVGGFALRGLVASELGYTPAVAGDWNGSADPGNIDAGLDQLAERTKDLETAPPAHAHEGTAILSTGETGGTKFLGEDGDGTSSWKTITGGGDALVANPLSQFAATTSSQLAGVISDETGSGALVFATSPTLVTPALGTPSSGTLTNCTGLPTAGLVDDAVTLAKMAAGTAGNLITYDASGNPAAVATGTATHVLTSNGAGAAPTFQAAAGGGLTNFTETLHTSSPNNTVNAAQIEVTSGTTNVDLVLTPKGNGAVIFFNEPDNSTPGGAKRGTYAFDAQGPFRNNSADVASGNSSFLWGQYSKATGSYSGAGGYLCAASGIAALADGYQLTASGNYSRAINYGNTSSAEATFATGEGTQATKFCASSYGYRSLASRYSERALAGGYFAAVGDAQKVEQVGRCKTTTNAAVELFLDGSSERLTIASGKLWSGVVNIVGSKSDGTAVARYLRQVTIKNVAGTTALVGSVIVLGTDEASGTSISITANDTNDALKVEATGITSETWRWVMEVDGIDLTYGT